MDADLYERLKYELERMDRDRSELELLLRDLNPYRNIRLRLNVKSNGRKYYYSHSGSGDYKYLGNSRNPEVKRIQRAACIEAALNTIVRNEHFIQLMLDNFRPYDLASVNSTMPPAYRQEEVFITQEYDSVSSHWLKEKKEFLIHFPRNHPERNTESASDGSMLKSKSEVIIYERLLSAGLTVVYELPLVMNDFGPPLYPDFTVLSPIDFKTEIVIEYVGMLINQQYCEDFAWKLRRYINNGYIPGVNLFFIYSDKYGHIDSMQINRVIASLYGKP